MPSPNKIVWSLSFTREVFSLQGVSPMTSSRPCKNNSEQLWYCQTNRKHGKTFFSQGYKLFQNEKNVLCTLCWMISYFSNHAITYIYNKDVFILHLWSLWWRVFWKFLVFSFSSEKKLFKIQEINKQTQTKWFLFLKKDYLNR